MNDEPIRRGERERQTLAARHRLEGLHARAQDVGDVDVLPVELDLAIGDARDVEQIVDESTEVLGLTLDDGAVPLAGLWDLVARQELDGEQDAAERVSELMPEHREELIA